MAIWKQEIYGTGRCVNCGFLGKRSLRFDEKCYHASGKDRIAGSFDHHDTFDGLAAMLSTIPWCFVGKADFIKELMDIKAEVQNTIKLREIIERDRSCPSWYPWREFATPKEHFEESMMLAMEKRQEEFEQQIEKERKEFELKLDERNREERQRTDSIMKWLAIAAIIFAVAEVVAALLGITSDSWILRFFR